MKPIVPSSEDHNEEATSIAMNNSNVELDLKEVFEKSPIAFCVTDGEGRLRFFNQAAVRLFESEPVIGSDMFFRNWKLYYSDGTPMPVEECPMARCISEGVSFDNFRMAVAGSTGGMIHLLVFSKPVLDDQGRVNGAHHTMVDVTEQRATDLKQETLSAIVESSDDAVVSKDLNGTILSWNKGAEKIFGYTEAEMLGKPMKMIIPENRQADEDVLLEMVKEGKAVHHYETIRKHKNGQEVPISLAISPIKDNKGAIIGASKVARDISERLRGEEKQAVLSAIVESSDDAIISKNLNGIILSWNKGAEQIFGYTEAEAVGKSVTLLIPEDRYDEENHILNKVRSGGKVDHFETVRVHKSGKKLYISLTVSPIRDNSGRIVGASKIARDISAQVKAKQEIARHSRNLEILNALGKSMSRKMDVQAVVQQVTTATTQLCGAEVGVFVYKKTLEEGEAYEVAAVSGSGSDTLKSDLRPKFIDYFKPVMEKALVIRTQELNEDDRFGADLSDLLSRNLGLRSVLAVPVITASGMVIGGLLLGDSHPKSFTVEQEDLVTNIAAQAAISIDNSRLFEQVKALSDKKDEFIALASHELRTPLTTINGYLQMLGKMKKDQMSELFLNKSLYQVRKLNTLVEDLLNMSRIEAGKLDYNTEDFDLCHFLKDLTETFAYTCKTHRLICSVPEQPVIVHADRQRIEQAVNNLLSNAVKYSPKADKVFVSLEVVDQGKVKVSIKDEGIGMTREQQKKLFSRFYRAENQKGISGLGLGLYLTKQIIDRHSGSINLVSEAGKGSEFTMILPIVQK